MRQLIRESVGHPVVRAHAEAAVAGIPPAQPLRELYAVYRYAAARVEYRRDPDQVEWLQAPWWVLRQIDGGRIPQLDCIPMDQRVIVRNKATARYEIIEAGHLQATFQEYQALSYNFSERAWEFRDITAWTPKGVKPVFQVRMLNGTEFRCTANHRLFAWCQNWGEFREKTLVEVRDGDRIQPLSLAMAKHIPTLGTVPMRSNDQLWVYGLYVAEGWISGGRWNGRACKPNLCIGGDGSVREQLIEHLESLGARWSRTKREQSGHVTVLKSPIKEALLADVVGHRARFKDLPESFLSLNRPQVDAFLEGYGAGDDFVPTHGRWKERVERVHNTSSLELAKKLLFFHRLKGDTASLWTQLNHQGAGRFPMYRVIVWKGENTRPRYQERLPGLANASWRSVTYHGDQETCDLSVDGTRNFVFENGIVAHNCDDLTMLSLALLGALGFDRLLIRVVSTRQDQAYNHVYGLAGVGDVLVPVDLTRAWHPAAPLRRETRQWDLAVL